LLRFAPAAVALRNLIVTPVNDALDLQDFCVALLQRILTEPERLQLAAKRRAQRRGKT
jgi:hypothetical protein